MIETLLNICVLCCLIPMVIAGFSLVLISLSIDIIKELKK